MLRFWDLLVWEGPDRGMRFSVQEGSYRVVVRDDDVGTSTVQMSTSGDVVLDHAQSEMIEKLFSARAERTRTHLKQRGPDIVLHDESVSRTHALIFVDSDGASVADLMSTNGTRVNGAPIGDSALALGDVIQIGKTKFKIEEG